MAVSPFNSAAFRRRGGFTLLEMVIVLAILAVVTLVATRSISQAQDQRRFEVSQRLLRDVRAAIMGDESLRALDGTPGASGFLADMGRFPSSLEELWKNTGGVGFDLRAVEDVEGLRLASGWRGPYLRLPIGASVLKDGWGRELGFSVDDGVKFWHFGADGVADGAAAGGAEAASYDADVAVWLPAESGVARVYGQLRLKGSGGTNAASTANAVWEARVYGPDPDDPAALMSSELFSAETAGNATKVAWKIEGGITPGPRAVLVTRRSGEGTNVLGSVSTVRYVTLRGGWNGPVVIELDETYATP
jgi:prepilin-type N-terminal cleavage/methylation domain-containing protein